MKCFAELANHRHSFVMIKKRSQKVGPTSELMCKEHNVLLVEYCCLITVLNIKHHSHYILDLSTKYKQQGILAIVCPWHKQHHQERNKS